MGLVTHVVQVAEFFLESTTFPDSILNSVTRRLTYLISNLKVLISLELI